MNMSKNSLSHFHIVKDDMLEPYDWKGNADLLNIVMIGVTNELPKHDEKYELHRLIGALLSDRLKENEKLDIIEKEYKIPLSNDFRKEMDTMCNLGQGIEDKAIERVVMNMRKIGYTSEEIAKAVEMTIKEVELIIKKNELVMV